MILSGHQTDEDFNRIRYFFFVFVFVPNQGPRKRFVPILCLMEFTKIPVHHSVRSTVKLTLYFFFIDIM